MTEPTENTTKLLKFIYEKYEKNELDKNSMVQIIELCGNLINVQTISNCAGLNNKSYNGIKKTKNKVILFGKKFVYDVN